MKVLICPLNWGLGHATRCIPIIRKYVHDGHQVTLVADGYPSQLLLYEFPSLKILSLPSYPIRYSAKNSQVMTLLRQLPQLVISVFKEHKWLSNLLKTESFDLVISDNRFGLWTRKTECIYITHQLMIKMPCQLKMLEPIAWWLHRQIINKYTHCWIPDYEHNGNLSGDLAHKYRLPTNASFIGPQSRFENPNLENMDKRFEIVAIISGIEPQRTLFQDQLVKRYEYSMQKVLLICGTPSENQEIKKINNITRVSHLPDKEFIKYLLGAEKIIARSGYSTIMDIHALNCLAKAEFIPTPGQTEQEYLYKYHFVNKTNIMNTDIDCRNI
jgi:uncharacterized protein (TIGR00661 family)